MYCSKCGTEIAEDANFCSKCGHNVLGNNQPTNESPKEELLCCPRCMSMNLHAEKSGFSGGKAFAGAVLTGGIGILAGTLGSKDIYLTCLKCGNRFKAGEAIALKRGDSEKELEKKVMLLLNQQQFLQATKLIKEETNCSLIEAKNKLDDIRQRHHILIEKNSGCMVMVLIFMFIGMAASCLLTTVFI